MNLKKPKKLSHTPIVLIQRKTEYAFQLLSILPAQTRFFHTLNSLTVTGNVAENKRICLLTGM